MNSKCYNCVYRNREWKKDENAYGCNAPEIGLCGEPKMKKRKERILCNTCLLCKYSCGKIFGTYGCDDADCGSPGFIEFKAWLPKGSKVEFKESESIINGTVSGVINKDTDPKYIIDDDNNCTHYILADDKNIRKIN